LLICPATVHPLIQLSSARGARPRHFEDEAAGFVDDFVEAVADVLDGPLVEAIADVGGLDDERAGGGGSGGEGLGGVDVFDFVITAGEADELPFVGGSADEGGLDDVGAAGDDGEVAVVIEDFVVAGEAGVAHVL